MVETFLGKFKKISSLQRKNPRLLLKNNSRRIRTRGGRTLLNSQKRMIIATVLNYKYKKYIESIFPSNYLSNT